MWSLAEGHTPRSAGSLLRLERGTEINSHLERGKNHSSSYTLILASRDSFGTLDLLDYKIIH